MSSGKITRFQNNIRVDGNLDLSNSTGNLTFSSLSSAPSSPTVGDVYYDSTLRKARIYQDTGWTNVDGSAAASLDAAYNGGATIAVDGGAVTLTDTQTATGGGLLITKSGVVTGADSASVFHINSTGAHDTSGALKMIEISVGTETVAGGIYGLEIAMNANGDPAIYVTKGAMTLYDGALTLTSGALTMTSGNFTMSSGNADITGTLAVSGTSTLAAIANSGSITSQGVVIIDADNAEAFLIRENADAADVLTVDTTQDAGDTTMLLTTKVTTGSGFHLDGSTITTGDALKVTVAAATMGATGAAISVVADGTEVFAVRDDGSVYSKATAEGTTAFQVVTGDVLISDGDFTVAGGEVALTSDSTTSGLVIVNNTFTTGNSLVDVSSTSITTGALMTLNANTAAHDGEVLEIISAGDATSTPVGISVTVASPTTGAARGIEVTMVGATTTAKGIAVTMDALTTGDMLYLDNGGGTMTAGSGFFINCNDDNASKFSVSTNGNTVIAGTAAGTAAMTLSLGDLVVTDSDASTISSVNGTGTLLTLDNESGVIASDTAVLSIDAGGAVASGGNLLRIAPSGSPNAGAIGIEYVGAAKAMTAMYIDGDPTGSNLVHVNCGGALTSDLGALVVSTDGALATGSNAFRVDVTGTPASGAIYAELDFAGVTDTNENVGLLIDATSKKVQALKILAAPVAGSTVLVTSTGALAADKATVELVSNVAACNADSSVLRVFQSSTTGVANVMTISQLDIDKHFINFEGGTAADFTDVISTEQGDGTVEGPKKFSASAGWLWVGMVRCAVNGVKAYIPYYEEDPS